MTIRPPEPGEVKRHLIAIGIAAAIALPIGLCAGGRSAKGQTTIPIAAHCGPAESALALGRVVALLIDDDGDRWAIVTEPNGSQVIGFFTANGAHFCAIGVKRPTTSPPGAKPTGLR